MEINILRNRAGFPDLKYVYEMTLVVARIHGDRIAVAADTLISEHDCPLPLKEWRLKSVCVPGGVCVSYSGSPDLAMRAVGKFFERYYPKGAGFKSAVEFFELESATSGNDYLLAFPKPAKLVTICQGRRIQQAARTHWIGEKAAFEAFRQIEFRSGRRHEAGRAISSVLFADEPSGSPASDLYSIMRHVALDRSLPGVGGQISVLSNRGQGFRPSVYCDFLLDWPSQLPEDGTIDLSEKLDLTSTGENEGQSVSQISSSWVNLNFVAFYHLKGRFLVALSISNEGVARCRSWSGIAPLEISTFLEREFGFPLKPLCQVASSRTTSLPNRDAGDAFGVRFTLQFEVNTFQNPS